MKIAVSEESAVFIFRVDFPKNLIPPSSHYICSEDGGRFLSLTTQLRIPEGRNLVNMSIHYNPSSLH
jgi:hypothetical protein